MEMDLSESDSSIKISEPPKPVDSTLLEEMEEDVVLTGVKRRELDRDEEYEFELEPPQKLSMVDPDLVNYILDEHGYYREDENTVDISAEGSDPNQKTEQNSQIDTNLFEYGLSNVLPFLLPSSLQKFQEDEESFYFDKTFNETDK